MPLITDPWFYAAAIPAVLLMGLGRSGFLMGSINLSKWIPYAWLGLLDGRHLATSLVLVPLGVWAGIWAARRIEATWFYRLAYTEMLGTGLKLLYDGLR